MSADTTAESITDTRDTVSAENVTLEKAVLYAVMYELGKHGMEPYEAQSLANKIQSNFLERFDYGTSTG